jgi:hypothetical protein
MTENNGSFVELDLQSDLTESLKYQLEVCYKDIKEANNDPKKIESIITDYADKFSSSKEEEIVVEAKKYAKELFAKKDNTTEFIYKMKEAFKWMFSGITGKLSDAQIIDKVFDGKNNDRKNPAAVLEKSAMTDVKAVSSSPVGSNNKNIDTIDVSIC